MTMMSNRQPRRAFTLIELIVAIGVVLILVAITATVGTAVYRNSEVTTTENTIKILDIAVQEWETRMDRKITHGTMDDPVTGAIYETPQATAADDSSALFNTWLIVSQLAKMQAYQDIIARIEPSRVQRIPPNAGSAVSPPWNVDLPTYDYVDSWDRPMYLIHPGRKWVQSDGGMSDLDGTIRTAMENRFGVARNRQLFWVSAGPDQQFGDLSAMEGTDDRDEAADNIYSYQVILP